MKRRTTLAAVAALLTLTGALLVGLFISDRSRTERTEISLPAQGGALIDPTPDIGKDNTGRVTEIRVDRTNVRRVIQSLSRPAQYSYTAKATYTYGTQSTELETHGWVRPGLCLTKQYNGDGKLQANGVLTDNSVYIWGADGGAFYQGAPGDFTEDDMGRLPTYETLTGLPAEQILDGFTCEEEGVSYIYVSSGSESSYTEWYISLDNGLLMKASTTEDGETVWSLKLVSLAVGDIEDSVFLLPNGTMPQ